MGLKGLSIILLAAAFPSIWAMPIDHLDCNANRSLCSTGDVLLKTRIIGRDQNGRPQDDRMDLHELARIHNWPKSKLQMMLNNTGKIHCPDMPLIVGGGRYMLDAFIVGSNVTLATAEHAFFRRDGNPFIPIEKFKECYFENRVGDRARLVFERDSHKFGNKGTIHKLQTANRTDTKGILRDWGIIRLAHPLPNAHGIRVDPDGVMPNKGQRLLNVSQYQDGMPSSYKGKTIGQYCINGRNYGAVRATCDSSGGMSGSIMAVEEGPAAVVAIGIVTGEVPVNPANGFEDGDDFDDRTNFTLVVPFDIEIVGEIRRIAGGRPVSYRSAR